jgi:hypothetical protein
MQHVFWTQWWIQHFSCWEWMVEVYPCLSNILVIKKHWRLGSFTSKHRFFRRFTRPKNGTEKSMGVDQQTPGIFMEFHHPKCPSSLQGPATKKQSKSWWTCNIQRDKLWDVHCLKSPNGQQLKHLQLPKTPSWGLDAPTLLTLFIGHPWDFHHPTRLRPGRTIAPPESPWNHQPSSRGCQRYPPFQWDSKCWPGNKTGIFFQVPR